MFAVFTYKRLAVMVIAVCALLIIGAVLSAFSPVATVMKSGEKRLMVIMYHQISENKKLWGKYVLPESVLEEDFLYMKENGYTPVSIDELLLFADGKWTLPEKPVLITFDDGQRSFLTKVVPLLEKYKYPAVVSVVGSLIDLYTENGDTDDRYAYLNWDDISALSKCEYVELGNHSYNMHSLGERRGMGMIKGESTEDYLNIVEKDIDMLQNDIYEHTGIKMRVLAYPYGIRNDNLLELAKEKGFSVTLTCREITDILASGENLYELGRFNRPYGISSKSFFEERYK